MVTDQQVRRLLKMVQTEKNFGIAAIKAGMDEKTARKYRKLGKLPSELEQPGIGESGSKQRFCSCWRCAAVTNQILWF